MNKPTTKTTAKLFKHGNSQAIDLPDGFLLPGQEVEVIKEGASLLLKPIVQPKKVDWKKFWEEMDALGPIDGYPDDRYEGLRTPEAPKID